jgi:8-oxo-dGTP pyrophosphatase MutT (NUDIX family)
VGYFQVNREFSGESLKQEMRRILSQRKKRYLNEAGYVPAAVLLPVYCKDRDYHVIFIRRTKTVSTHKGEISFPGGRREKGDKSLLDTALRESEEEIGLKPEDVEILGELDDNITTTSNHIISPFVALIPYPYSFKIDNRETEEIIAVPLKALFDKNVMLEKTEYLGAKPIQSYSYNYEGKVIFGATARILNHFLGLIGSMTGGMWCTG